MSRTSIIRAVIENLSQVVAEDKRNVFYLLYYSILEGILLMVSPLASAFIINSVIAHATISITAMSIIVLVIFFMISVLQIVKEYIVEKFEQKIFVQNSIKISQLAIKIEEDTNKDTVDKFMNYFFDVISIQKIFPILLLNGSSLVIKVIMSMILLLIFNLSFFVLGLFFILFFVIIVLFLGRKGPHYSIERSDAKHEAIYYLQSIPFIQASEKEIFQKLDTLLINFIKARERMFSVVAKQLSLTFFLEGIVLSSFFIIGGYLVFEGLVPIGEFVAAEIVVISLLSTLRDFMKQIDYMYDMIEGFYKVDKLKKALGPSHA